ncbi:Pus10 [Symbiodinium sp. KB8]|nr:Pus10 [Symbiodinium sp. KB8]
MFPSKVCWCSQALTAAAAAAVATSEAFEVNQKTPLRVLHRRALATRPKTVFSLGLEVLNPHYFKLRVCAQAGMYIKEFVHGDLGRTIPSMRSLLGGQVEILQLDVEGVEEA